MVKKHRKYRKKNKRKNMRETRKGKDVVLTKAENDACWKWARSVGKERPPKEQVNKPVFCPACKKVYCLGYDNIDQYCKDNDFGDCPYFVGCKKEVIGKRTCKKCRRTKNVSIRM